MICLTDDITVKSAHKKSQHINSESSAPIFSSSLPREWVSSIQTSTVLSMQVQAPDYIDKKKKKHFH